MITSGTWGLSDKTFAASSFTFQRTPAPGTGSSDRYFQGTLGFGYSFNNMALDAAFIYASTPLEGTTSVGFSVGYTYLFVPGGLDASEYSDQALTAAHTQIYENLETDQHENQDPLFWIRIAYNGNSMSSTLLDDAENSGKETSLTIDGYYPFSQDLLLSAGVGFYSYDDSKGFFDRALENAVTAQQLLLQSTLQGLPHTTISLQASYQITARDAGIPRYQATEIDSTRTWSHTFDLGWRHQFTKQWYLSPLYEVTLEGATTESGVILELLCVF